tara:strand:+ start:3803 stop:4261 length:459 start_codon:yes stop_codon:yes gene_type:complete
VLKTTGINIRKAVEDDLLDCLMLFKQFHKESKLPYSWDAKKTQALFLQTLPMEEIETFVAEIDGDVVGFIVCQVMEPLFSSDKVSTDIAWFVNKDHRNTSAGFRLMKAYEEWAVDHGIKFIGMAYLERVSDLSKYYEKKGYVKAETHYMKEF